MKFLDLFAGIGGFRLGMESAGHECIGFCEIDKFARASYKAIHNTEGEIELHDITAVSDESIRRIGCVDIICGGFPCQAFSIAGNRRGFEDTRGTLFFEIARFASILRPKYLLLENVKGLLNHDGGATFETILGALDELGYNVEWQILNSKDFGVPQNRERIYTLGHLRSRGRRQVLPISRESSSHLKQLVGGMQSYRVYDPSGIATTLVGEGGGLGAKTGLYLIDQSLTEPKLTVEARCLTARYTAGATKRTAMNSGVLEVQPILTQGIKVRNGTKQGYQLAVVGDSVDLSYPSSLTRRARVGRGIAHNLSCSCQMGAVVWKGRVVKIRRLTPKECFRLQGFSDDLFEKAKAVNSDAQLYKQAGNGVTVPVVYAIGCAILSSKYHQK